MEKNAKDNKILILIAVSLIFLCGIIPEELILIIQAFLIITVNKIKVPKKFVLIILFIIIHATINTIVGNDNLVLIIKQIIGIVISFIFYYNIIRNKEETDIFFDIYLKFSIVVSLICIIQQVAHIMNLNFLFDLRWLVKEQLAPSNLNYRSVAIFREPSECALILLPSFFFCIYYFLGKNRAIIKEKIKFWQTFIIIAGFLLTFSSAGYIGALGGLIIIWMEYKHSFKQILILIVLIISSITLYNTIPDFKMRVNDTLLLFLNNSKDVDTTNLSTQTIMINGKIAIENFINTYGFGGGIGSHLLTYEKLIDDLNLENVLYFWNKEDANSLFIRLISELGIFGLLFLIIFIKKYSKVQGNNIYSIYSKICISYFLLRLLRYGHYFNDGLWAFIVIFILLGINKNNKQE